MTHELSLSRPRLGGGIGTMAAIATKQPGQHEANNREHPSVPEYADQLKSHVSDYRADDTGNAETTTD